MHLGKRLAPMKLIELVYLVVNIVVNSLFGSLLREKLGSPCD